ncbi:MAG: hypothetical protein AB8C84_01430 [Oligoflexales bacterium]
MNNFWKKCGPCGKEITHQTAYFACGTSSCQKSAFCSLSCWNAHIPLMKHKDAWAEERISPGLNDTRDQNTQIKSTDVLVVASKLKAYIKESSGLNTSASALTRLSDIIRLQSDKAMKNAKNEGRKTVLDRDFLNPQ